MSCGNDGQLADRASEPAPLQLRLLDGFDLLRDEEAVALQPKAQQLLAFLALCRRPAQRSFVASSLWWETSEHKAQASLRSTLWRLRQSGCPIVEQDCGQLQLAPGTTVDVCRTLEQARRLLAPEAALKPGDEALASLRGVLLPGWCQEWVVMERERLRQLQLHALERLGECLLAAGRSAHALDAALLAVAAEPLRESAQRLVVSIHLAEGNQCEALRQYASYSRLLKDELGVSPSAHMLRLITGASPSSQRLVTSR